MVPLNMFKSSGNCFTDRSKAVLLLRILFVIYVPFWSLLCYRVCSVQPLGSLVCCVLFCVLGSIPHRVSGVRCGQV